jgi:EAL domain-containing protein (putative c-di-GMP-specific phosphodiesterase class I)
VNAPTGPALTITVNISGRQVQDSRIVADVAAALATSGLPANTLVLELTESVLMQNTEATLARLRELKRLGVRLAIDDFGTGYSSLGYLQRFPIDVLKIAKSFVDGVVAGTDGSALARAIIALADTLRLRTVAEGIETAEQWEQLRDFGCELGQGYHFARPLPEADVDAYLRRPRGGAIASA